MKIVGSVTLLKQLECEVGGHIDIGYSQDRLKQYELQVSGVSVTIQGEGLNLTLSNTPNLARLEPAERGMVGIFAMLVFGPLQEMYERTSESPVYPSTLANESRTKPTFLIERSKILQFEGKEQEAIIELIGREPEPWETKLMDEITKPSSFKRREIF